MILEEQRQLLLEGNMYNDLTPELVKARFDCVMLDGGGIEIGDNVLFGPRVGIYTSNHAVDAWERSHGACYAKKVKIIRPITEADKTGYRP